MRHKDDRISLICDLFGLNSRTTAGRKINNAVKLKKYETFFLQFSNTELQEILDFIDNKTATLSINIHAKEKKAINAINKINEIDQYFENVKNKLLKDDKTVLKIYKTTYKVDREEFNKMSRSLNSDNSQKLEDFLTEKLAEWDQREFVQEQKEYAYLFNYYDQNIFKCQKAFHLYFIGEIDKAITAEIAYRLRHDSETRNIKFISYKDYRLLKVWMEPIASFYFEQNDINYMLNLCITNNIHSKKFKFKFDFKHEESQKNLLINLAKMLNLDGDIAIHLFQELITEKLRQYLINEA